MKVLVFEFSQYVFEEPFNSVQVKKGMNNLDSLVEGLDAKWYCKFGNELSEFRVNNDGYVIIKHSFDLNKDEKGEIIQSIKQIFTLKKGQSQKYNIDDVLVVFEKISDENCCIFDIN